MKKVLFILGSAFLFCLIANEVKAQAQRSEFMKLKEVVFTTPDSSSTKRIVDLCVQSLKKKSPNFECSSFVKSSNFSHGSIYLESKKDYNAVLYLIPNDKDISKEKILNFLKQQKSILLGPPGLFALFFMKSEDLAKDYLYITLDEETSFFKDTTRYNKPYVVPSIKPYSDNGDYSIFADPFDYDLLASKNIIVVAFFYQK